MSQRNIDDTEYGPILIKTAGNTIHVGENGAVIEGKPVDVPEQAALTEDSRHAAEIHDNTYVIDGRLVDSAAGLFAIGARDDVTIGDTGSVYGGLGGIWLAGDASRLSNSGEISGSTGSYGVYMGPGTGSRLSNDGMITGTVAIGFESQRGTIVNGRDGVIAGDRSAIEIPGTETEVVRVINHGLLIGSSGQAIVFSGSKAHLVNDGTIEGSVAFGSGVNTFDNRGGVVKGAILGGVGNVTLITDNANDHLSEAPNRGTDTVKSTVSYTLDANIERLILVGKADISGQGTDGDDVLRGNDGRNTLTGLGGADILSGGKGNDILSGGDGGDTFVFATGYGKDTIEEFLPGAGDFVNLHGWIAIRSFSQLFNHASDHGASVWITAGDDTLVIANMHKADLGPSSNEFLF